VAVPPLLDSPRLEPDLLLLLEVFPTLEQGLFLLLDLVLEETRPWDLRLW
jgi:hypothetical protein